MLDRTSKLNIAYIHGRPCSHPMQQKMARAIGANFSPVDFILRWHDKPNAPRIRRYLSWILCSIFFPNARKYDVYIAAGAHVTIPLMRYFKRITARQKIIVHLGDELLYSIYSGRFSESRTSFLKKLISKYDAIICEGKMGKEIINMLLGENSPKVYTIINGIEAKHLKQIKSIEPKLNSKNILFMGQGPGKLRFWYKGIDLLLNSFKIAHEKDSELSLTIVGDWDKLLLEPILSTLNQETRAAIEIVGYTDDLTYYIHKCSLYLHPARGEAFGITVLISLAAGIPTMVSEWTGAKEVVEKVSKDLIVPLDPNIIANKILWYFSVSDSQKKNMSALSKEIGLTYTEERAIREYCETFEKLVLDFNI